MTAVLRLLVILSFALGLSAMVACERGSPTGGAGGTPPPPPAGKVVLYSSLDPEILGPIVERFERETGISVAVQGDTEATKATGLAMRLIAEAGEPKADVWWSSECLTSVRLAREGVITGWTPVAARPRVVIVNSERVKPEDRPRFLREIAHPRFAGRVGLARPQFGTMRAHLAAVMSVAGHEAARAWLEALKEAKVRLYDGNASVARAVASGEIWVGVVDIDDALAAQANSWPVHIVSQRPLELGLPLMDGGTLLIPGSAGLVRAGPNPDNARRLLDYITSPAVEEQLVTGPQKWTPLSPAGRDRWPGQMPHGGMEIDWTKAEAELGAADDVWRAMGL